MSKEFLLFRKKLFKKNSKSSLLVKKDKEIIDKTINHLPNLIGLMENKNSTYI